ETCAVSRTNDARKRCSGPGTLPVATPAAQAAATATAAGTGQSASPQRGGADRGGGGPRQGGEPAEVRDHEQRPEDHDQPRPVEAAVEADRDRVWRATFHARTLPHAPYLWSARDRESH